MIDRSNAAQQATELSELLKVYAHAVQARDAAGAVPPATLASTSFFVGTFAGADQKPVPFAVDAETFKQSMQLLVDNLELDLQDRGIEIGVMPIASPPVTPQMITDFLEKSTDHE